MIKRWYFILSTIWVVFWTLDIFFLIPQNPLQEMRLFATDELAFSIYWLWITAPILLFLAFVGIVKFGKFVGSTYRKLFLPVGTQG